VTSVGLLLPTREAVITRDWDARKLVDLARRAEASGFDSVWAGDSLLARPRFDPLTLLASVASVTTSIALGTAALTGSLRHPLLAAHVIATVDRISEGRLTLGLGAGFPYPATEAEFAAVGVPFVERLQRMLETVRIWRLLWGEETISEFTGRYWTFAGLEGLPRPAHSGGPPLWLAGAGPTALARTGALFDGWLPYPPEVEQYRGGWAVVQAAAVDAGRDPSRMTAGLYVTVLPQEDPAEARRQLDAYTRAYYRASLDTVERLQAFVAGPREHCLSRLREYVDAGAEHIVLRIGSLDPIGHFEEVAQLAKDVARCR
jgi:alkanesulfonate monooxygenase SsuD/methylene tetrahydromethanopterin reductase-like flavin-dependent oxidoreductase (luciferase family)